MGKRKKEITAANKNKVPKYAEGTALIDLTSFNPTNDPDLNKEIKLLLTGGGQGSKYIPKRVGIFGHSYN